MRLRIAPEEIGLPHVQFQDLDGDWRWFCDCAAEWDADELVRRFNAYDELRETLGRYHMVDQERGDELYRTAGELLARCAK